MCALYVLQYPKGNSEIEPTALAVIELRLS